MGTTNTTNRKDQTMATTQTTPTDLDKIESTLSHLDDVINRARRRMDDWNDADAKHDFAVAHANRRAWLRKLNEHDGRGTFPRTVKGTEIMVGDCMTDFDEYRPGKPDPTPGCVVIKATQCRHDLGARFVIAELANGETHECWEGFQYRTM